MRLQWIHPGSSQAGVRLQGLIQVAHRLEYDYKGLIQVAHRLEYDYRGLIQVAHRLEYDYRGLIQVAHRLEYNYRGLVQVAHRYYLILNCISSGKFVRFGLNIKCQKQCCGSGSWLGPIFLLIQICIRNFHQQILFMFSIFYIYNEAHS